MNSRLLSITAIIIAVGFASNVLLVNPAFAGDSEARKIAREKEKQLVDAAKKDKDKAVVTKVINMLNKKLDLLQTKLAKDPTNNILISKIADVMSKITKWQKKL